MGQSMGQWEMDYSGSSFTANAKAVNPSPVDATGIFVASYLQSVSKNVALGVEVAHQRPDAATQETQLSYVAKVSGSDFVLTTNVSQIGVMQTSYVHKVNEQIELGADLQLMASQGRREGVCTVGGKWEFRAASFRGMVDTAGRVGVLLEERLAPGVTLLFSGELDHYKGDSKFGLGMQMEH
jgi:mitochondrial import receptor subunit TOM40